jgi:two-component system, sensor histidine kinase and response regulator
LIEDDPAGLMALAEVVRTHFLGASIDTAANAESALLLIAATEYDAIISDIKMPGMDGVMLLKEIKDYRPETPVLLVTGHSNLDIEDHALRLGVFAFIEKPINIEHFVATGDRAVKRAMLVRRIRQEELKERLEAVGAQPLGWTSAEMIDKLQEVNEQLRRRIKSLTDPDR